MRLPGGTRFHQDLDFDRAHGLRSIPVKFGVARALAISRATHVIAVVCLAALNVVADLGWLYLAGVAGVAALLVWYYGFAREPWVLLALGPLVAFFGTGYFSGFGAVASEIFPTSIRATAEIGWQSCGRHQGVTGRSASTPCSRASQTIRETARRPGSCA